MALGMVSLLRYWANEDFSTIGGDWAGGSCRGRSLLQNFVRLNATSTISWATLWSVYESWRYFGNGLVYGFQPWSGNYTVPPAIWTSALVNQLHGARLVRCRRPANSYFVNQWYFVNQFAAPGWFYLGGAGGSGMLPKGGSWTAMVPPLPTPKASRRLSAKGGAAGATTVASAGASEVSLVIEKLEGACLR